MLKFFTKKRIFIFLASFFIVIVVGFFGWNMFADSVAFIKSRIFTASVSSSQILQSKIWEDKSDFEPEQDKPDNQSLADFTDNEIQNPVAISEQEKQDLLDDIQEKIDIIKQKINDLLPENSESEALSLAPEQNIVAPDEQIINLDNQDSENLEQNNKQNQPNIKNNNSGGGAGRPVYKKLLISEVQAAGIDDEKQEFVELYNPNLDDIDLTSWYLQRKTKQASSWTTYAPNNLFSDKKISAKSYFLIARTGYYSGSADIFTEYAITDDNSLALKNPNGEISDKLGFGDAADPELLPAQNPVLSQSIGRKLGEQDTDNNLEDFEFNIPTPKAENIKYVEPPAPTDTTPPEISFTLNPIQNSLTFTINFTIVDPVDAATSSGLANYVFQWKEEGGDWQQDLPAEISRDRVSVDLTREFTGEDGKTYYFQIKATDIAGNISDWLPIEPVFTKIEIPIEIKPILINEIQIAGQTVKDEFIELYNPNNIDVDLLRFALKKKVFSETHPDGSESPLVNSTNFSGIIPALGYFLIVPQNNEDGTPNYTGLATPDLYYSGKSYSVASDNTVLLYDKNNSLQDKVGFGEANDFETASAQNPEENKSIARKELGSDTDDNGQDFIISDAPSPTNSLGVTLVP